MINIIADIICQTFRDEVGIFQSRREHPEAMHIEFRLPLDHDKEDGYRYVDLVLFAHNNYVQVMKRDRWIVISHDDMWYDSAQDELFIKPGKDYTEGNTGYSVISDHDSGWRDGVGRFLEEYKNKLNGLSGVNWYRKIPWKYVPTKMFVMK
jgi:hypothetical protein